MLSLRIERLGDITVIHCAGRMVFPYNREFRIRLLQQIQTRTLVLEFVDTITLDASGLGLPSQAIEKIDAGNKIAIVPDVPKSDENRFRKFALDC